MRISGFISTTAALIVLTHVSPISAQQPQQQNAQRPPTAAGVNTRKAGTAARVTEAPAIDGILDEGVWKSAKPMSDFVQAEPLEGEAAISGSTRNTASPAA